MVLFLTELFIYQATAEQIRLAQMIYDKNDADFEDKVKQVMCITVDIGIWNVYYIIYSNTTNSTSCIFESGFSHPPTSEF